ncbi:TPA: hypothetical protein ACTYE5_006256, partial [Klebsiella michiganensis]
ASGKGDLINTHRLCLHFFLLIFKEHHPLSFIRRGVDVSWGGCRLFPGCEPHPFENLRRNGKEQTRAGADVRYGGDIICRVFGKKCRRRASAVLDSQAVCGGIFPGEGA